MPTLLSETQVKLEWSDLSKHRIATPTSDSSQDRAPGWHLSGVIKHALVTAGLMTAYEIDTEEFPLRMGVGMAWEQWIAGLMQVAHEDNFMWQPGSLEVDNVHGSPDGLLFADIQLLVEFKATWRSRHEFDICAFRLWMWQLAGYLYMMGLNEAELHVLWVCGDWRPPAPDYRVYRIRFEDEELKKFWKNVVLKNRDQAKKEG